MTDAVCFSNMGTVLAPNMGMVLMLDLPFWYVWLWNGQSAALALVKVLHHPKSG